MMKLGRMLSSFFRLLIDKVISFLKKSSFPIVTFIGLVIGYYSEYHSTLKLDVTNSLVPYYVKEAEIGSDSTFKALCAIEIEIKNTGFGYNNLEEIIILPVQTQSKGDKIDKIYFDKSDIGWFRKKRFRIGFWLRSKQLIVSKNPDNTYRIRTCLLKFFFLDKYKNQIVNIDENANGINVFCILTMPKYYNWAKERMKNMPPYLYSINFHSSDIYDSELKPLTFYDTNMQVSSTRFIK